MGLDQVEIIMRVEESFGLTIVKLAQGTRCSVLI
jgi:hypothetical protein